MIVSFEYSGDDLKQLNGPEIYGTHLSKNSWSTDASSQNPTIIQTLLAQTELDLNLPHDGKYDGRVMLEQLDTIFRYMQDAQENASFIEVLQSVSKLDKFLQHIRS